MSGEMPASKANRVNNRRHTPSTVPSKRFRQALREIDLAALEELLAHPFNQFARSLNSESGPDDGMGPTFPIEDAFSNDAGQLGGFAGAGARCDAANFHAFSSQPVRASKSL
jgi:hypothetical protein